MVGGGVFHAKVEWLVLLLSYSLASIEIVRNQEKNGRSSKRAEMAEKGGQKVMTSQFAPVDSPVLTCCVHLTVQYDTLASDYST